MSISIFNEEKHDTLTASKFYFLVLTFFMSFWLVSLISAIKIVQFMGITLTGGFFIFPFTMSLNTVIVETYGYKNARQAIWSGTILCMIYLICIHVVNILPSSPEWTLEKEFQSILIPNTRIIIASLLAFWFSGFTNNYLMAKLKNKGNNLLFRILVSSASSIIMDLTLFFTVAFIGAIKFNLLCKIFIFAFIKKIFCEIILLPFIWYLINLLKRKEGFEINDLKTDFSPFSLDNVYDFSAYKNAPTVKLA